MNDTNQLISLARHEQAEDAAFNEQAFKQCEHIWEKVEQGVWECAVCGDLATTFDLESFDKN